MMDNWFIVESSFEPDRLRHKETVFATGNGYLGTRGSFEEGYPGEQPATLIHGVFDDIPIVFTELANTPNWINFDLFVQGERFLMDRGQVFAYRRELNMRSGLLTRQVRWQSSSGATVNLQIDRFASLADEHLMCIRYRVTSVDFNGDLEFRAGLPGHMDNAGWVHWVWMDQGRINPQSAFLQIQTRASGIELCEAFHLGLDLANGGKTEYWDSVLNPTLVARTSIQPGQEITATKIVAVYTSRDVPNPKTAALEKLATATKEGYQALRAAHSSAWAREWEACNITIEGDDEADRLLRYNLFQLLAAAPRHDDRVSIPAKGLSGFGYRGHVFWDTEIFGLPFFIYTRPQIARNLLMYRYHTLQGARGKARAKGYEGAMYAWESAATGKETTPRWVPGPEGDELVRIWPGDIEHHISADVAYAVMQYWQVTGDDDFMRDYGAEIVLDTASFWASRAEWNAAKGVYEITDVIGPDEYHDHVDNNAYTNHLARWNLQIALKVLDWLRRTELQKASELESRLDLNQERLAHWKDVIDKLTLGFDPQTGLFEQFEGFFQRTDLDLQEYEPRTKSIQALLGIERTQEFQVIKQPDVLMLLYLLSAEYDPQVLKRNWDYYTPRTDLTFGSSLGPAIQSILAARLGEIHQAYRHFMHALRTDLDDVRGNAGDGLHAATAGGVWQAAVFGFGGLKLTDRGPAVEPRLPEGWKRLKFRIVYRGEPYEFDLARGKEISTSQPAVPDTATGSGSGPWLPIRGAIFDLDGVLTDTSELHYLGWKRLADEEGIPFNRHENESLRGVSRRESLLLMLKGQPATEERMQEMMDRKNRYYQEAIATLTRESLLPGARQLLEELRGEGVKIAVGSASKNARQVVEKLGLGDLIDAISDGYSVTRQKPAPDLFLHAAAQLSLPAGQCVVFEDAAAGVEAALAAGMWAVGIGPPERVGKAYVVITDLQNITWRSLLEQIERKHLAPSDAPSLERQT